MDPSVLLAQLGPSAAFLGLVIWIGRLYFSGRLVPRSTVIDMKENFTQQIAREREISDNYRQSALVSNDALLKISSQSERLLEGQKTVEAFILSLPRGGVGELPAPGSPQFSQGPGGTWQ